MDTNIPGRFCSLWFAWRCSRERDYGNGMTFGYRTATGDLVEVTVRHGNSGDGYAGNHDVYKTSEWLIGKKARESEVKSHKDCMASFEPVRPSALSLATKPAPAAAVIVRSKADQKLVQAILWTAAIVAGIVGGPALAAGLFTHWAGTVFAGLGVPYLAGTYLTGYLLVLFAIVVLREAKAGIKVWLYVMSQAAILVGWLGWMAYGIYG